MLDIALPTSAHSNPLMLPSIIVSLCLHGLVMMGFLWLAMPVVQWSAESPKDLITVVQRDAPVGVAVQRTPTTLPSLVPMPPKATLKTPDSAKPVATAAAITASPAEPTVVLANTATALAILTTPSTPILLPQLASAVNVVFSNPVIKNEVEPVKAASSVAAAATVPNAQANALVEAPISNAAYLNNPLPQYPAQSRRLGEQGTVKWRVLIGTDGKASQPELVQSSGFSRLDEAAKQAVLAWRYLPGKRGGVPQPMPAIIPLTFNSVQP
jgi:periplasmic protein TonB